MRTPRRYFGLGLGLLMAGLAIPGLARAEADIPAVRLAYRADRGCPDSADFLGQLHARTASRLRVVERDGEAWQLAVTLSAGPQRWTGRLETRSDAPSAREVEGETCHAVAAALAIATALALDAELPRTQAPERAVRSPGAGVKEPAPTKPRPARPIESPPARQPAPTSTVRDVAPSDPVPSHATRWGFGLSGGAIDGPLPGLSTQATAAIELAPSPALAIRLLATRIWPRTRSYDWGTATVDAALAGLQVCPLRWPVGALALRPCLAVDAGVLAAEGQVSEQPEAARSTRQIWVDMAPAARLEWPLDAHFWLELQGTLVVPLTRYRYVLAGEDSVVAEAAWVHGGGSIGAVASFP